MSNLEESTQREAARTGRKLSETTTDVLEQVSKIAIYSDDFRVGGAKEGVFRGPSTIGFSDNASSIGLVVTPGELQHGAYTNTAFDKSTTAEMILESTRATYQSTETGQGQSQLRKIDALMGMGVLTEGAKNADMKVAIYDRDSGEVLNLQDALSKFDSTKGKHYVTSVTGSGYRTDFNANNKILDDALAERGINGQNLTVKDIDKMIGGKGKHSYGNQQSHIHSGTSKVFTGGARDKFSGAKDAAFHRNTGWAGNQKTGVLIDPELRTILQEKRRQVILQGKMNPRSRPGGFEDGVGKHPAQGGIKGLGRAWAYESIEVTDFAEGYSTFRAVKMATKAGALVGIGASSAVGTIATQTIAATGRIGAHVGKGAVNLGGRIYSIGSPTRAAKWQVNRSSINAKFDTFDTLSKDFGKRHQRKINENTKNAAEFMSKKTSQKAKVVVNGIKVVVNGMKRGTKWAVGKIGNTALGKAFIGGANKILAPFKRVFAAPLGRAKVAAQNIKAAMKWLGEKRAKLGLAFAKRTKWLRAPFSILNWFEQLIQKALIKVAIGALGIILVNSVLILIACCCCALFPSTGGTEGSRLSVDAMVNAEKKYINNATNYYLWNCDAKDENGWKLHWSHYVAFNYRGASDTSYANLTQYGKTSSYVTTSDGISHRYDRKLVYKAIISMAIVQTQGTDNQKLFEAYCELMMNKYLHATSRTHSDTSDGEILIDASSSGLTDLMKLTYVPQTCIVAGCCGKTFPAINEKWLQQYDPALTWNGWSKDNNYSTALMWYEEDVSMMESFGIKLPALLVQQ